MTPLTLFLPPTSFNFVVRTGLLCCHGDKRLVLFSVGTNAYTYFPLHREILNKLFYFLNALFIYLYIFLKFSFYVRRRRCHSDGATASTTGSARDGNEPSAFEDE